MGRFLRGGNTGKLRFPPADVFPTADVQYEYVEDGLDVMSRDFSFAVLFVSLYSATETCYFDCVNALEHLFKPSTLVNNVIFLIAFYFDVTNCCLP